MTSAQIIELFTGINCAPVAGGFAPHKPILLLLVLNKLIVNHKNNFEFAALEPDLKKLLEKYGSNNASNTRNEPFWRLKNDGIWDVIAPIELLQQQNTPSPNQLIACNAAGLLKSYIYRELLGNSQLIDQIARAVLVKFVQPKYQNALLSEAAPNLKQINRNYWWVSQNQTYKHEVPGNFMWSPKTNRDGGRNVSYDFMTQMLPGDVVFSFADTKIKAIGVVNKAAVPSIKHDFGLSGANWLNDGWFVDVAFEELKIGEFKPLEHMELIRPHLPDVYSPIRPNGVGNQIYLAKINAKMADILMSLTQNVGLEIVRNLTLAVDYSLPPEDSEVENDIQMRTDIGPTQKIQIISSRRGQGVFKANVRLIEKSCRVTKISSPQHLIASHIKPWTKSDDTEKLSGYNGLLLAPHIDHLFDKGFISFQNNGQLLLSQKLDRSILGKWSLNQDINVGNFRREQQAFLEYHREIVLK